MHNNFAEEEAATAIGDQQWQPAILAAKSKVSKEQLGKECMLERESGSERENADVKEKTIRIVTMCACVCDVCVCVYWGKNAY